MKNYNIKILNLAILFLTTWLLGCKPTESNAIDLAKVKYYGGNTSISPLDLDSLIFVFNVTRVDDTSWHMTAYKEDSMVIFKVHEVTPKIIAENFSRTLDTMLFRHYEGYTVTLPFSFREKIVQESGLDDYIPKDPAPEVLMGRGSYKLFYKDKTIINSQEYMKLLIKLDNVITKNLINKIHYRAAHTPSKYVPSATEEK